MSLEHSDSSASLEMASVLFMDIVGFSRSSLENQRAAVRRLQEIVRETREYRLAESAGHLIKLPTGDGMALCFASNPIAPVRCAVELQSALRKHPDLPLRTGIHMGAVFRHSDIKDNTNVVGDGINIAQRVMDCGDAGHILVSQPVAGILEQTSEWAPYLHDLGTVSVKHGVGIRIFNIVREDAGNAALPSKLAALETPPSTAVAASLPKIESQTATDSPNWGPFKLLEKVGQGSFGELYRAFDPALEREVAVKLLLPRFGTELDAQAVVREARLLARVRHPNVVSVYGVDTFDGRVGFWSDFVHGQTLSALLAAQGRFGPREASSIGINVCRAVSAVHAAGLLHRDIKTGNVMREEGGRILLMDFGLSLESGQSQSLSGTPAFMAPELFSGQPATVASDIYAIGVLLYQLLAGKYPVDALNFFAMKAAHESGTRRSLFDIRPDLPPGLARAVETALATDPKKRFESPGQMIAALSGAFDAAPKRKSPALLLMIAAAASVTALALAGWFTFFHRTAAPASGGSAHADYIRAADLLDHFYQPHNMDSAIELFVKTVAEDPRFALAYAGLCRAYFLQYRDLDDPALIEKTQAACLKAISLDRDLASAHVTLGMLYTQTSRNDLAAQELREAQSLDEKNSEVWAALSDLYNRQGRTNDVEPALQKAADLAPDDWRWPNQMGYHYLSTGKLAEAVGSYQQAVKINGDNPRLWNNLGIAYRRQMKLSDSEAAFTKAIALDPRDIYLSNLGNVLDEEGKYPEAAELYEKAARMNPSSYLTLANLASVYDRMPGEKDKARDTYLKAIALGEELRRNNPKDATLLARLGSYYATLAMPDKSLPLLRQAGAFAPDDPQVLFRVGEGYELLHRREDALRWIGRAIDHKYSVEALRMDPEMKALLADPRFATISRQAP